MTEPTAFRPATLAAVSAIGAQIGVARRDLRWSSTFLAERMGIGARLIRRIEAGHPGARLGTVFEAAITCGVPLFGVDPEDLGRVARQERDRLALLPARVPAQLVILDDDF